MALGLRDPLSLGNEGERRSMDHSEFARAMRALSPHADAIAAAKLAFGGPSCDAGLLDAITAKSCPDTPAPPTVKIPRRREAKRETVVITTVTVRTNTRG